MDNSIHVDVKRIDDSEDGSASRNHSAESYKRLYKSLDRSQCFVKYFGLCDVPSKLVTNSTSRGFKIYSWTLALISLMFTVSDILYYILPQWAPRFAAPLRHKRFSTKLVYILIGVSGTLLRLCVVAVVNDPKSAKVLAEVIWGVRKNSFDSLHEASQHHRRVFERLNIISVIAFCVYLAAFLLVFVKLQSGRLDTFEDWYSYAMLFENMLYCSAWISSNALLLILTLGPIQFALLKTHEQFQEAVRKHSSSALKVAISKHDQSWEMIRFADKFASLVVGVSLTTAVPIIAIVGTSLLLPKEESWDVYLGMSVCSIGAFVCAVTVVIVAAKLHNLAHASEILLLCSSSQSSEFQSLATLFLLRFAKENIGFTYFGFGTVTKNSLLTFLSLLTTYLLIGIQLQDKAPGNIHRLGMNASGHGV